MFFIYWWNFVSEEIPKTGRCIYMNDSTLLIQDIYRESLFCDLNKYGILFEIYHIFLLITDIQIVIRKSGH